MRNVVFEEDDRGVVRITLVPVEGRSTLTPAMVEALELLFIDLTVRTDLRAVIVIAGSGDVPIGTDPKPFASNNEDIHAAIVTLRKVCDSIESCSVPVIAVVDGPVSAAACELVLACHIRIASSDARFSLKEVELAGVPVHKGIERLKRRDSQRVLIERTLMGEEITADEVLRSGIINRVVHREQLQGQADDFAQEVTKLAPLAIKASLKAVLRGPELSIDEGLELEAELFSGLFATDDMREGTTAFLQKRAPVFEGK